MPFFFLFLMEDDLGSRAVDSSVPFLVRGRAKTQVVVSWSFCEATLSTDSFVSDLAGDRVLSAALWVSTCPTEPLPTGDRCFLYPPGWPAFMSGKLNISKLFPGSCSLKSSFLRVRCQFLLALVGGGTSGKFFIMN